MTGILVLAILLALLWILLVGAIHVSVWFVHVLIVVAIVALVYWFLARGRGPRTRV